MWVKLTLSGSASGHHWGPWPFEKTNAYNSAMTPSSSSTSLSQVSAQSPMVDDPPHNDEEQLRAKVNLLQNQVVLLQRQIESMLNKPKRGVRVQAGIFE